MGAGGGGHGYSASSSSDLPVRPLAGSSSLVSEDSADDGGAIGQIGVGATTTRGQEAPKDISGIAKSHPHRGLVGPAKYSLTII